jgi:hypothetical protein
MDADIIASLVATFGVVLIAAGAGVLILRPLTKRIGDLLGAVVEEKRARTALLREGQQQSRIMEAHSERLELLEQRLQFAEGMVDGGARKFVSSDPKNDGEIR